MNNLTKAEYVAFLKKKGYEVNGDIVRADTPYGPWIQTIVTCIDGSYSLKTLVNPLK